MNQIVKNSLFLIPMIYAVTAFVAWEPNPANWHPCARAIDAIIFVVMAPIIDFVIRDMFGREE